MHWVLAPFVMSHEAFLHLIGLFTRIEMHLTLLIHKSKCIFYCVYVFKIND